MPLPAALAAKLAKRGIVNKESNEPEEEVIAENYDAPYLSHDPYVNNPRLDEFGNFISEGWKKVWDPEYETFYYWDTKQDMVSWLPPGDPEAVISLPAKKLKEEETQKKIEEKRKERKSRQVRWQKTSDKGTADPMDPSSYSDAPTGDWSRGLKKLDDAKSGVDSTASGPLFQQRPYPAPGEVLKRNQQAQAMAGPQKPS